MAASQTRKRPPQREGLLDHRGFQCLWFKPERLSPPLYTPDAWGSVPTLKSPHPRPPTAEGNTPGEPALLEVPTPNPHSPQSSQECRV
ncbi:PREDICTED: uncharacterized protein LOC109372479 isoform X2 [Hipposideros armiger]|uniref:Uncharacterized protein LOC109372479 isoform X2 n=1 Tax=Hipposideros armiger TaxID=186990 RepID=A0A8B7PXP8_HIPAR|nr:PREDICTED: uncharacterized protein LOC109372479 isoform X2 [Hipposideros armiger]